ncbi:MAG: TonB-dependent receptor [Mediterranea sp.]|nr:TonB-dependent receptor [Mediterranea sp.]
MTQVIFRCLMKVGILSAGLTLYCHAASLRAVTDKEERLETYQVRARKQISGRVTDPHGEPLAGAMIRERASGNGVVTDLDGNFNMSVPSDAILEVSYFGYKPQEIAVGEKQTFLLVMEEEALNLGEVVVVGYGVQRKANLSGAVDQVSARQLEARPISSLSKGLQGVVPNLNIDFTSGELGQAARINIRGESSINGGNPLILIDGVASDAEELNRLLPEDIESLSVLKDASSAAIYGARAAFGVILITTKQGNTDRIQVAYNSNFAWKRPSVLPTKTSDPYIYLKLKNIAVLNTPWSSGHVTSDERLEWARQRSDNPASTEPVRLNPLDQTQWEYMGNRDWTDFFLNKNTFSHTQQVSVSGATPRSRFYLSVGFDDENGILTGIVPKDDYRRYSFRSKESYKLWDWFELSDNLSFVNTIRTKPSYYGSMQVFYDLAPSDYDLNPDGTWANSAAGITMAQLIDGGESTTRYSRLQNTFSAELSFFEKALTVNSNFTFVKGNEDQDWYRTPYLIGYGPNDVREENTGSAYKSTTNDTYTVFDLFATYNKVWGKHAATTLAGFNQEYSSQDWYKAERGELISSSLPSIALASGDQVVSQAYTDWAIRGFFFRANYIFNSRYIVELNGRYDGTSRFPKDSRFGFFPSASLAWRVDEEAFFEPLREAVSQLKLRASYGSLGNQLVSEYGYIPVMASRQGSYLIDGKYPQVVTSPSLVSSNYTWEKVTTQNLGLDLGFMDNKLSATFDLYRRNTKGMLTQGKQLPGVLGAGEPNENAADMKTIGWELSLGYANQFRLADQPFSFNARFLLSDNRSQITRFDNPGKLLADYYVGQELGEIWGLESDGFFQTEEEIKALDESTLLPWGALEIVPGWPKYVDQDGDRAITKGTSVDNPGDLRIIGNRNPRFRYGFNLNLQWGAVDLTAFLQGIGKRDYYPLNFLYWGFYQQPYAGGQTHLFDFYRPTTDSDADRTKHSQSYLQASLADQNLNAAYPAFQSWLADKNLGTSINDAMGMAIPQTQYLLNGAYLRVKNLTLGYTLPAAWLQKVQVSRLRLFVSADNLYEWSALRKYFDPEAVTDESGYGYTYPFSRQYSFGLNLTL